MSRRRLIILLILTCAACVSGGGRPHQSELPRKWPAAAAATAAAATDKRSAQPLMDPCQKERSMKMICHCDQQQAEVRTAECWILKNDLTAHDPLWRSLERHAAIAELKFIVQSGNLHFMPTQLFKKFTNLAHLTMSFSNINEIGAFAFANSSSLRTIRLNNNNLTALRGYGFANHQHLERIDLQENELATIDAEAFANLSKLEYLALNNNKLSVLAPGSFRALKNLQELQLQHNQLGSCVADLFLGLENLRVLKLSSNKLKSVENGAFIELWSLQELYLDNNLIEKISERAFDGLNNLRKLSLQRNQLKQLERAVFTSLPGISVLNLSQNKLKVLHHATFASILENFEKEDSSLAVHGNEFVCDCKLDWIVELINRTQSASTRQSLQRVTCLLAANTNIPDELLLLQPPRHNGLEVHQPSDYISDDGVLHENSVAASVDLLQEGSMVNLSLLDQLPCREDESDPTSLPLPRESIGLWEGSGGGHPLLPLTGLILGAFVISLNNNNNRPYHFV